MTLKDPTIRFYLQEGELRPAVIQMPGITDTKCYTPVCSLDNFNKCTCYQKALEQALANPILFKNRDDEEKVKRNIWRDDPQKRLLPELGKPYKIEGEVEIREDLCNNLKCLRTGCVDKNNCQDQFAFLKPKDVFDTGARLPEQKEESQITEEEFRNFIRTYHLTDKWEKFIHRKP